jgi:hypothetical protein
MKSTLHYITGFYCITVMAFLLISTSIFGQDEPDTTPAKFKISIESSNKFIKLVCMEGCNWKELQYLNNNTKILQSVNRYGMIDLTQRVALQSEDVNDFLFTIEPETNSIRLKGIEGTAWKELSFDCMEMQCTRVIDAYGVGRYVQ